MNLNRMEITWTVSTPMVSVSVTIMQGLSNPFISRKLTSFLSTKIMNELNCESQQIDITEKEPHNGDAVNTPLSFFSFLYYFSFSKIIFSRCML